MNSAGAAYPDDKYAITFALYDAPVAGTPVWTERHEKVGVIGGFVNVFLGSINPFLKTNWSDNVNFGATKYLGITVDADGDPSTADKEMSPRQLVITGFYSPTTERIQDYGWDVLFGNQNPNTGTVQLTKIPQLTLPKLSDDLGSRIPGSKLEADTTAQALAAQGQVGVASGGIITSVNGYDPALLNGGYTQIGAAQIGEGWQNTSLTNAPTGRHDMTFVWSGSEFLVWGGADQAGNFFSTGARYNPLSNTWTSISSTGAPSARAFIYSSRPVWTGSELIIWGSHSSLGSMNDGALYNPTTDQWRSMTTSGAPSARTIYTSEWMPQVGKMFVWGGATDIYATSPVSTGGIFDPSQNSWTATATLDAPSARAVPVSIWTGTEILLWGGWSTPGGYFTDGRRYNPVTNTWSSLSVAGAPSPRTDACSVWTGSEWFIWGGARNGGSPYYNTLNDGALFNPSTNTWRPVTSVGAPPPRESRYYAWTGKEVVIWGGYSRIGDGTPPEVYRSDGWRYDPAADQWSQMSSPDLPGMAFGAAAWLGDRFMIFGGRQAAQNPALSSIYTPPRTLYLYQKN